MSTPDALWAGAVMVLAGMGVGLFATMYHAWRRVCRPGRLIGAVADWGWWIPVTLIILVGLFVADWGQLRAWSLVLLAAGAGIWWGLAHSLVDGVLRFVGAALLRAIRAILAPWRWAFRRLAMLLAGVARTLGAHLPPRGGPKSPPSD
jgi:spore cortex biosynthesis protein YabQ